ncbi:MAG: insulinase family protein [Desulfobacterales bacterium]|nr:MAG: insulinase family protein [Desulfobacterales bacterium]
MNQVVKKTTLKNGVKIVTKKMPYIHSVSMGVWVNVGVRDESTNENGLSHFIEHMIFKGTKKRSSFQIAKEFDAIGGHTNAFTSAENTCYHAKVMGTHLETMVDILSDIFLNSVFDDKEIENERSVILQEISMTESNPDEYVHVLSGRNFWGDNALGRSILGTRENVSRFDASTIKAFFHRFYQPERIVISVAGDVEHDRFTDIVGPVFESVQPGVKLPKRVTPGGHGLVDLHYRDLKQMHICLGVKGIAISDPRRYAYSLMNTILGGNMSSRLFQEVRERRGLAYSVFSFITSYADTGMFGAYVGVEPKNAHEAIRLILNEIHMLMETRVDPNELHDAKEYTKGSLMLSSESNDNQMVRLAQNETYFREYIPLQKIIDEIDAVTQNDILELAENLFQSDRFSLTLLGPVTDEESYREILNT